MKNHKDDAIVFSNWSNRPQSVDANITIGENEIVVIDETPSLRIGEIGMFFFFEKREKSPILVLFFNIFLIIIITY